MKPWRLERYVIACAIAGISMVSAPVLALTPDGVYVGAGAGVGRPLAVGDNKLGFVSMLSGGYAMANGLRPELELSYRPNNKYGASERAAGLMGNLWYDFWQDDYYFYAGGGAGGVRIKVSVDGFSGSDTEAAWQAGFGFGHTVTRQLILGVDYRHLGSFNRPRYNIAGQSLEGAHYMTNAAMIELRYVFGGHAAAPASSATAPVQVVPLQ